MSLTRAIKHTGRRRVRESEARRGAHFSCPDCGAPCVIRSSSELSDTMRALEYDCTNHECGASFAGHAELTRRLSLPAQPNPAVNLPLSNRVDRARLRAVLDTADEQAQQRSTLPPVNADLFDMPPAAAPPAELTA